MRSHLPRGMMARSASAFQLEALSQAQNLCTRLELDCHRNVTYVCRGVLASSIQTIEWSNQGKDDCENCCSMPAEQMITVKSKPFSYRQQAGHVCPLHPYYCCLQAEDGKELKRKGRVTTCLAALQSSPPSVLEPFSNTCRCPYSC